MTCKIFCTGIIVSSVQDASIGISVWYCVVLWRGTMSLEILEMETC